MYIYMCVCVCVCLCVCVCVCVFEILINTHKFINSVFLFPSISTWYDEKKQKIYMYFLSTLISVETFWFLIAFILKVIRINFENIYCDRKHFYRFNTELNLILSECL